MHRRRDVGLSPLVLAGLRAGQYRSSFRFSVHGLGPVTDALGPQPRRHPNATAGLRATEWTAAKRARALVLLR